MPKNRNFQAFFVTAQVADTLISKERKVRSYVE